MQNLKENWLVACKMTENFVNFHASSQKSENLHFDELFLSKAYKVLDEKLQKSYVSWHWRVMQNLKENWLVAYKKTQGIQLTFIRAVESLETYTLMGSFCPKHIKI